AGYGQSFARSIGRIKLKQDDPACRAQAHFLDIAVHYTPLHELLAAETQSAGFDIESRIILMCRDIRHALRQVPAFAGARSQMGKRRRRKLRSDARLAEARKLAPPKSSLPFVYEEVARRSIAVVKIARQACRLMNGT